MIIFHTEVENYLSKLPFTPSPGSFSSLLTGKPHYRALHVSLNLEMHLEESILWFYICSSIHTSSMHHVTLQRCLFLTSIHLLWILAVSPF